ncbi:TonB-dependent receptor [Diaphorobacter sp.]|uniref:TonB-dependent receptor plug domain-containing protein n=1 Tax=Diaphorobacter sp. TaxID=1934310 RepID=UPI0028AD3EA1|nr:TonB-dependent receptor [Diaphorobacter sp.]
MSSSVSSFCPAPFLLDLRPPPRESDARARNAFAASRAASPVALLAALTFSAHVLAGADLPVETSPAPVLPPVEVTTTVNPRAVLDVQAAVQVVDRQDLDAASGTSVTEALRQAVGVDARTLGSGSAVSIRGFSLNSGAMLVDGLRRPSKYGGINASLLQLEDTDRIEIVRGPMSALYGADATGGAINVISRSPLDDKGITGSLRLVGGATEGRQRHTGILGAALGFGSDDLRHRISLERRHRGLFRYDKEQPTADLDRLGQTYASYDGAYRISGDHNVRWTLEFTDQNDEGPGWLTSAGNGSAPAAYTAFERERRWFGALHYRGAIGAGALEADVGYGTTDASTSRSFPKIEFTDYQQLQGQARYAIERGDHSLLFGGGSVRDDIDITINSGRATRTNTHLLAQDEWTLPAQWKLLAGLRHDRFTDFGSVTTPRLSLQRTMGPWQARLGYGEAYRAPTVIEQHSSLTRGTFLIIGNPDLKPETNKSWEAALFYRTQDLDVQGLYFRSRVHGLINTVNEPREPGDPAHIRTRARYVNIERAHLEGLELSAQARLNANFSLNTGWEYLDARDASTQTRLTGHARQIARAGLRWNHDRWRADVLARYYFDYYAADSSQRGSAPINTNYGTADLKVRYRAAANTSIALGVDNLFARRQPMNFNSRGSTMDPPTRFFYLELSYAL